MQLSIFSSGVDRVLLKKTPIHNFFTISILLIISTQSMRIYSMPLKQNAVVREGIDSNFSSVMGGTAVKKLRKLPHVFNTVLELPFRSDADVEVEENEDCFRFAAEIDLEGVGDGQVRAQAVEIHPGVTKVGVVVRNGNVGEKVLLLKVDTWRYRLPASTIPELATAVFVDGELIVTVPKHSPGRGVFDGARDVWGGQWQACSCTLVTTIEILNIFDDFSNK